MQGSTSSGECEGGPCLLLVPAEAARCSTAGARPGASLGLKACYVPGRSLPLPFSRSPLPLLARPVRLSCPAVLAACSDSTDAEIRNTYLMNPLSVDDLPNKQKGLPVFNPKRRRSLLQAAPPLSWDWRTQGVVSRQWGSAHGVVLQPVVHIADLGRGQMSSGLLCCLPRTFQACICHMPELCRCLMCETKAG
ncbi:hypothetical protein ABPG75_005568 [Micractinium tetrahymenae]